jgi:hypothetical protein
MTSIRRVFEQLLFVGIGACAPGSSNTGELRGSRSICPVALPDTSTWRPVRNTKVGAELLHNEQYSEWLPEIDTNPTPTLRLDAKRPGEMVSVFRTSADTRYIDSTIFEINCTLPTRSGPASAILRKVYRKPGQEDVHPLYTVQVRLRPLDSTDSSQVLLFISSAFDSAGYMDQIRLASTLRAIRRQ